MTASIREPLVVERMSESDPLTHSTGWPTIVRGLLAILFGVIALARPQATALALVIVFAVWAFVDGGFALYTATQRGRLGMRWGWFLFEGLVSIGAGIVALSVPGFTILVLTIVVAARAIVMGAIMLTTAFTSKGSPPSSSASRWTRWASRCTGSTVAKRHARPNRAARPGGRRRLRRRRDRSTLTLNLPADSVVPVGG
jgi:uncharacterized membrane protein HdeD (DUF308 family)